MSEKRTIISANRLLEGDIVYFTGEGWSTSFAESYLYAASELKAGEALAQKDVVKNLIVGTELVEVMVDGGLVTPVRTREVVRAVGPTVGTEKGSTKLYDPTVQNWQMS